MTYYIFGIVAGLLIMQLLWVVMWELKRLPVGTKSVLFGAHCFFIHPFFVAAAWWKLYGLPLDPRLWWAFIVHDIGYMGKPNMDGPDGEQHVRLGAKLMAIFDSTYWFDKPRLGIIGRIFDKIFGGCHELHGEPNWHCFVFFHSRFMAKHYSAKFSKLCVADKLALVMTPAWLYLPCVRMSGEIYEYMQRAKDGKYQSSAVHSDEQLTWYRNVQSYLKRWVEEHKDMRADTWTPHQRESHELTK